MLSLSVAIGNAGHRPWPGLRRAASAASQATPAPAAVTATAARAETFRPDIEGLRGVAILLVLLFHADLAPMAGGFIGVDVFFVISGFLITGLLVRERERTGHIDLVAFYGRRVRRLMPAAIVVVAVILPLAMAVLAPLDRPAVALDGAAAAVSAANVRFAAQAGDYFAAVASPSPFLHFWSLSVEEQFYLVWPVLLLLGARTRRPRLGAAIALGVVLVASLAASLVATDAAPGWAFYMLPTRAWQLSTGGLLAIGAVVLARVPNLPMAAVGWAGLAAVVAAPVVIDPSMAYPGVAALLPTLGAAALIAAGQRRWSPGRLLAIGPLRFLGRISYSLYLWHWPILVLPAVALGAPLDPGARAGLIGASIVVATVSWALVEEPFRRGTWRLAMRPSRALAAAATALAFVVAFSGGLWTRTASDLGMGAPWPIGAVEPVAADDGIDWTTADPGSEAVVDSPTGDGSADAGSLPDDGSLPPGASGDDPGGILAADGSPAPDEPDAGATADPATADPASLAADIPSAMPTATARATSPPAPPATKVLPGNVRPTVGRAREDRERLYGDGCLAFEPATAPRTCVYGVRTGRFTVALIGDSHASHLFPAVQAVAARRGWRLEVYVKVACPFIDLRVRNLALKREYTECARWRTAVLARLADDPPDLVLVSNSRWTFPVRSADRTVARQSAALARMIERLPGRVVVIADTPAWNLDVPGCLSAHPRDIGRCAMPRRLAFASMLVRERAATRATGAGLVDLSRAVCSSDPCPAVVRGMIVLRDTHHFTATFARSLAPTLDRALATLLAQ